MLMLIVSDFHDLIFEINQHLLVIYFRIILQNFSKAHYLFINLISMFSSLQSIKMIRTIHQILIQFSVLAING